MLASTRIGRRLFLGCLGLACTGAGAVRRTGVEVQYHIESDQREYSGVLSTRVFDGAMVLLPGENQIADVRDDYRIGIALGKRSDPLIVRLVLWDNFRKGEFVGSARVELPLGGEARVTLLTSDNLHYPVVLHAREVPLP